MGIFSCRFAIVVLSAAWGFCRIVSAEFPTLDEGAFFESFNRNSLEQWAIAPEGKVFTLMPEMKYGTDWQVSKSADPLGEDDYSLKTTAGNKLQGISRKFDRPVEHIDGVDTVIQYEVKFPEGMECGGGYIKLVTDLSDAGNEASDLEQTFDDLRRVVYVYGPDECFEAVKMYFMMMHETPPGSGKDLPKQEVNTPPASANGSNFNAYTLVITKDKKYKLKINGVVVHESDYSTLEPPVLTPQKIKDPNAVDPNQDYKAYIPDPDQTKPDDWDESQPQYINDPNDEIPSDWMTDLPLYIENNDDELKRNWVVEILGDYEAPKVLNPECESMRCGPWSPRQIPNPEYRGKWSPQIIPNPVPPVEWEHPLIDNPDYIEDTKPESHNRIIGVVFDIWATHMNVEFDNIYVGHSEEVANQILEETTLKRKGVTLPTSGVLIENGHQKNIVIKEDDESPYQGRISASNIRGLFEKYIHSPKDGVKDIINIIKRKKNESPLGLIFSTVFAVATLGVYLVSGSRGEQRPSGSASKTKKSGKSGEEEETSEGQSSSVNSPTKKGPQSSKDAKSDTSSKKKKQ